MHSILSLVYREQTSRLMTYRALPVGMTPNLFMNKMNRCTLEVQVEPGDVYGRFRSVIGLSTCSLQRTMTLSGVAHMSGSKETVAFWEWLSRMVFQCRSDSFCALQACIEGGGAH